MLVKKANTRMELIRKAASFNPSLDDLKTLYILYVRSILEQSCAVWNSSLTMQNSNDLERVQKAAVRIMLGDKFENYEEALEVVNLQKLTERRNELCLKFAKKCTQSEKTEKMFPLKKKMNNIETRKSEKFRVNFAKTERLKKSAIPNMQRMLNKNLKNKPG